jgi:maleylpyruvate isomerase
MGGNVLLYNYFRSSAAFRVRIALNLKGLEYDSTAIHLTKDGGKQFEPAYRAVNPQMRVPTLKLDDGATLIQSLAIMEYLDEVAPQPPFLPKDPVARAHVRAVAQIVACDIHPVNNTSPLGYLRKQLKQDDAAVNAWYQHWVHAGFDAIEALIPGGTYAFGNQVTLADICLVPQVYNARRFKVDVSKYPKIAAAEAACMKLAAFEQAKPENQPDAE